MKLMILDGNSVINRAFYGVRPLTTRDGLYTNAIYGFLNILGKERSEEKPDALCVAFDLHAPTFRHLRYDGYKATRHPMPEELAMQMPVMKQVLAAMNIPVYACEGWEADDVLGTVGRLCEEAGWDCAILTGDRDSLQLVDEHVCVRLVRTQGGQTRTERYTPDVFRAEYGLEPKRLIDLKALMGDSSDNIPGVAGVGPKTANDLLKRFGTLDGVYANLSRENMKGKLFDKLENGRESAYLSYELATIRCDAPIDFTPENNLIRPPKRRALYDLFTTLEFQRLIDRYGLRSAALEQDESEEPAQPVTGTCTLLDVQTPEQAQQLLSGVTLSIAAADDLSMLVAAPHMDGPDQTAYVLRRETLGTDFVPLLQRLFAADVPKTVHDSKPLLRALLALGVEPAGIVFDTAVAAYLLDATRGAYALPQLAQDYLHIPPADETALQPESVLAIRTACIDGLTEELGKRLREQGMQPLFENIELPLCPVLAQMEHDGILVDAQALHDFGEMLSERIDACESLIFGYAGETFNLNSTRQLGVFLFETLGLPPVKKTKSGYSTNAEVLEKLRDRHPAVQAIMDYRMLTKLKSTYADGLQKVIGPDGRIRTTFQNTVTATGRLSSTDPNLQNIPVRTELGSEIRRMFVPRRRLGVGRRGLQPDRAARAGAYRGRYAHAGGVPLRRGLPCRDGLAGVRRAAGIRYAAHAPPCQGRELRHRLRHLGVLAGAGHRRLPRGGQGLYRQLSREIQRRACLYARYQGDGARKGLCGDDLRPPPRHSGDQKLEFQRPLRCGAHRAQHARAGQRGGHHQAGHGARVPCARGAAGPAAAAGAR